MLSQKDEAILKDGTPAEPSDLATRTVLLKMFDEYGPFTEKDVALLENMKKMRELNARRLDLNKQAGEFERLQERMQQEKHILQLESEDVGRQIRILLNQL